MSVSKFQVADEMVATFGDLSVFFKGLEAMIGAPSKNVMVAMEQEHIGVKDTTGGRNSDELFGCSGVEFTSNNYGVRTTPEKEWRFVVYGEECAPDQSGHRRKAIPIEDLMDSSIAAERISKQFQHANKQFGTKFDVNVTPEMLEELRLRREEITALRMYTGPMYMFYNVVLRSYQRSHEQMRDSGVNVSSYEASTSTPGARGSEKLQRQGKLFTTTLHAINSGIIKLSRIQPAATVYRGMYGMKLPQALLEPNAHCVRGGIEYGFMSTTMSVDTATMYAGVGKSGTSTLFMMRMGLVDRGAQLDWLSQYPDEAEILFAPLTAMEIVGEPVNGHDGVTRYDVRLNCNLRAVTIDELLTVRRSQLVELRTMFSREMEQNVELPRKSIRQYKRRTGEITNMNSEEVEKYNNTDLFLSEIEKSMRDANMLKTDNAFRAERMRRQEEGLRSKSEQKKMFEKIQRLEEENTEMGKVIGDYDRLQERLSQHYRVKMGEREVTHEAVRAEVSRLRREKIRALMKGKKMSFTIKALQAKMLDMSKPRRIELEQVRYDKEIKKKVHTAPDDTQPEPEPEPELKSAPEPEPDPEDDQEALDFLSTVTTTMVLKRGLRWLLRQRRERRAKEAERAAELAREEDALQQRNLALRSRFKALRRVSQTAVVEERERKMSEAKTGEAEAATVAQKEEEAAAAAGATVAAAEAAAKPPSPRCRQRPSAELIAMKSRNPPPSPSTPPPLPAKAKKIKKKMLTRSIQCDMTRERAKYGDRQALGEHLEHALAEARRENGVLRRERTKIIDRLDKYEFAQVAMAAMAASHTPMAASRTPPRSMQPRNPAAASPITPQPPPKRSAFLQRAAPRESVVAPYHPLKPVMPHSGRALPSASPGVTMTPSSAWPSFAKDTKLSHMRSTEVISRTRWRHDAAEARLELLSRGSMSSRASLGSRGGSRSTMGWNPNAVFHDAPRTPPTGQRPR